MTNGTVLECVRVGVIGRDAVWVPDGVAVPEPVLVRREGENDVEAVPDLVSPDRVAERVGDCVWPVTDCVIDAEAVGPTVAVPVPLGLALDCETEREADVDALAEVVSLALVVEERDEEALALAEVVSLALVVGEDDEEAVAAVSVCEAVAVTDELWDAVFVAVWARVIVLDGVLAGVTVPVALGVRELVVERVVLPLAERVGAGVTVALFVVVLESLDVAVAVGRVVRVVV